jgi:hypothetical protein
MSERVADDYMRFSLYPDISTGFPGHLISLSRRYFDPRAQELGGEWEFWSSKNAAMYRRAEDLPSLVALATAEILRFYPRQPTVSIGRLDMECPLDPPCVCSSADEAIAFVVMNCLHKWPNEVGEPSGAGR